jgi:hypothetical protein
MNLKQYARVLAICLAMTTIYVAVIVLPLVAMDYFPPHYVMGAVLAPVLILDAFAVLIVVIYGVESVTGWNMLRPFFKPVFDFIRPH